MHLHEIIARWGYLGVGLGAAVEGESVVVTAGALAHKGLLTLPFVMITAFVGAVAGDQLWFQIGRRFGKPFIDKRPWIHRRAAKIDKWTKKFGNAFVVAFRFIYGIRMATPVFLGARNFPFKTFLALDLLGGALWAVVTSGAGYLLGASLERVLHRAGKIEEIVIAAVIVSVVIALVAREIASRRALTKEGSDETKSSRRSSSHRAAARSASARGSTHDP